MEFVLRQATAESNWLSIKCWLKSRRKLLGGGGDSIYNLIENKLESDLGCLKAVPLRLQFELNLFQIRLEFVLGNPERCPLALNLNSIWHQLEFIMGCWAVFVEFHMGLIENLLESPLDLLRANAFRFQKLSVSLCVSLSFSVSLCVSLCISSNGNLKEIALRQPRAVSNWCSIQFELKLVRNCSAAA